MPLLDLIWLDLVAMAIGLYGVNSAISGELRNYTRGGGRKTIYRFKTVRGRLASAILGLVVLACVVVDLRRKFPR